jgi:DNA-binding response OmpR family regulator
LGLYGNEVTSVSTAAEAMWLQNKVVFHVYLLDKRLPGKSGIDLCGHICAAEPTAIVIFFSASAFLLDRKEGIAAGGKVYSVKPDDFTRLPDVVAEVLKEKLPKKGSGWSSNPHKVAV